MRNSSLVLNGINSSVNCGTANPGNTFSVGGWFYWNGDTGNFRTLISKRTSIGSTTMMWQMYINNGSNQLRVIRGATIGTTPIYLQSKLWYHIVWTSSGTNANQNLFYINGGTSVQADGNVGTGTGTGSPIVLGGNQNPAQELFDGAIDDVFICNAVLSQADIQNVMARNFAPVPNKWALWTFDERNLSTATDSWGANTGTISNGVLGSSAVPDLIDTKTTKRPSLSYSGLSPGVGV